MPILGGFLGSQITSPASQPSVSSGPTTGVSIGFSTVLGTSFTLQHDLNSTNLIWAMFITSVSPEESIIPDSVKILDANTIRIDIQTPMDGKINLIPV